MVPAASTRVDKCSACAGTTTAVLYGAVFEPSLDVAFRAAEEHGIRAVIGKVMMDRLTYDETLRPADILELSLRQSADLCARWHDRDGWTKTVAFMTGLPDHPVARQVSVDELVSEALLPK